MYIQKIYAGLEPEIPGAQARGKPVIIYKDGNVPKKSENTVLKQKMNKIWEKHSTNLRKMDTILLKDAAMKYARQLTREKIAQQTLEAYSDMLRNHI